MLFEINIYIAYILSASFFFQTYTDHFRCESETEHEML